MLAGDTEAESVERVMESSGDDVRISVTFFVKFVDYKGQDAQEFQVRMESSLDTVAMVRRHGVMVARLGDRAASLRLIKGGLNLEDHFTLEEIGRRVGLAGYGDTVWAVGRRIGGSDMGRIGGD